MRLAVAAARTRTEHQEWKSRRRARRRGDAAGRPTQCGQVARGRGRRTARRRRWGDPAWARERAGARRCSAARRRLAKRMQPG
ncbi:hypothetical protein GUJ93_ZPchr0001g29469 [Zizania palustris]|uniref:Uncharacterized protein n=1 Tax=Zizania palustris TaxID=103762 RepID=A0A8J5V1V3_ZIZPA|nr:hypothetical protein GUJ93_ZPchr0001g31309 [Zizania palustris]KAG8054151.1 hypothetical protein GUJ93_ZPchr0001g29729 [Zizania palustris]KAG8054152.1 hypothetical protein GUJ93_ZPchr0001g29469 [Zizania palustris]